MNDMVEVSEATFREAVEAYPSPLKRDVCGIAEPPVVSYNDFTLGNWPDSVVASYKMPYTLGDKPSGYRVLASML